MNIDPNELIRNYFSLDTNGWKIWMPAENVSRQSWQEFVETLLNELNADSTQSHISLSDAEISLHYHLPLIQFSHLLKKRLLD
ncbi:MAG: hypothetical protein GY761_03895 [Hyphomicrobiales bacterium]|nr:hypothetical protein [Hyphomicrobiales bacterium]